MERAVRDLRQAVNLNETRFRLVLNKWDDRLGIDAHELVTRLGLSEFGRIPYATDLKVELSLNHSKPMVLDKPNEVSDAIIGMVSGIYRPVEQIWAKKGGAKAKRSFFGFGRRKVQTA
jgi:Flp pilus assembly CpaE family ATPase